MVTEPPPGGYDFPLFGCHLSGGWCPPSCTLDVAGLAGHRHHLSFGTSDSISMVLFMPLLLLLLLASNRLAQPLPLRIGPTAGYVRWLDSRAQHCDFVAFQVGERWDSSVFHPT